MFVAPKIDKSGQPLSDLSRKGQRSRHRRLVRQCGETRSFKRYIREDKGKPGPFVRSMPKATVTTALS